jgi:hypothetical protein
MGASVFLSVCLSIWPSMSSTRHRDASPSRSHGPPFAIGPSLRLFTTGLRGRSCVCKPPSKRSCAHSFAVVRAGPLIYLRPGGTQMHRIGGCC